MTERDAPHATWLVLLGIVLAAFNFRTPITSVSPLLEVIEADLRLGYASTSLLTSLPTLCFGLFAFAAAPVAQRYGRDRGVLLGVALLAVGLSLRVWGRSAAVLFATAVVTGAGIAFGQTLVPSIIGEHFPDDVGSATGLYTTALVGGAGVVSGVTPVLDRWLGSWPLALAVWAIPAIAAVAVWSPIAASGDAWGADPSGGRARLPWSTPRAWLVTAFFGLQSTLFYTTVTWLAPRYAALGWSTTGTGTLLAVFFGAQLLGTFALAPLSDRRDDRRPWLALATGLCAVGYLGVVFAPLTFPWLTTAVLGVGVGGIFALALTVPVDMTADPDAAGRLTSMMVGAGYLLASVGPFLGGVLRDHTGSNRPVFFVLLGVCALLLAISVTLGPAHRIQ